MQYKSRSYTVIQEVPTASSEELASLVNEGQDPLDYGEVRTIKQIQFQDNPDTASHTSLVAGQQHTFADESLEEHLPISNYRPLLIL